MKEFFKELWAFMRFRKRFWLLPVVVMLALFAILLFLLKGKVIAPFIYTIF